MNYVDAAVAPLRKTGQIKLYGPDAFAGMRKAGRLAAECLDMLVDDGEAGRPDRRASTGFVFEFAMDHGALPATLMYRGYRKSTCTSINHVVCHGIPNDKPLKEGDIVNIDVTLHRRRLARRLQPHVSGRRDPAPRRAADRGDLRGHDARHRGGEARPHHRRHRRTRSRASSSRST